MPSGKRQRSADAALHSFTVDDGSTLEDASENEGKTSGIAATIPPLLVAAATTTMIRSPGARRELPCQSPTTKATINVNRVASSRRSLE